MFLYASEVIADGSRNWSLGLQDEEPHAGIVAVVTRTGAGGKAASNTCARRWTVGHVVPRSCSERDAIWESTTVSTTSLVLGALPAVIEVSDRAYTKSDISGSCVQLRLSLGMWSAIGLTPVNDHIGFYRELSAQRLLTGTAQMFDERGRGLILRGGRASADKRDLHPYLDHADASDLVRSLSTTPAYR
jgi:hypothetical protein